MRVVVQHALHQATYTKDLFSTGTRGTLIGLPPSKVSSNERSEALDGCRHPTCLLDRRLRDLVEPFFSSPAVVVLVK